MYAAYAAASQGKSNGEAREIARDILGVDVSWSWDRALIMVSGLRYDWLTDSPVPRTREGYYHYTGGIEVIPLPPLVLLLLTTSHTQAALSRTLTYAPHADLIWLETKKPDLEQARHFARRIRERFPGKWLVYNLSPSFNWDAHGFTGAYSFVLA
jgi:isocitrate lyase